MGFAVQTLAWRISASDMVTSAARFRAFSTHRCFAFARSLELAGDNQPYQREREREREHVGLSKNGGTPKMVVSWWRIAIGFPAKRLRSIMPWYIGMQSQKRQGTQNKASRRKYAE